MSLYRYICGSACLLLLSFAGFAQQAHKWGSQGDGTYANPILPGDFQNTDVIRVGNTYYYISATKELSPGMAILSSTDLVNWKYVGHAVPDITQISPRYSYATMQGTSRGIWAGALRYQNNRFYVYFTDPDFGIYMTSAAKPEGPWKPLVQLLAAPGWDDPCPLWDDDKQAYLIATNFADNYKIHLFKMDTNGEKLQLATDTVIYQDKGSEANKLYKINGYYYHFYSIVTGKGRSPFMTRSKNIYGPYEGRRQLVQQAEAEPNQGGMLQTQKGDWYFITHHGKAYWSGRETSLVPINWQDGWPLWGTPGSDGVGRMVWSGKAPLTSNRPVQLQSSDEFGKAELSPQWEWYFQPWADKWSLTQRPGYLRLYACRPLQPGALNKTANVLTQRPMRVDENTATVKLDIQHMADGQVAGLSLFGKTTGIIGVQQLAGKRSFYTSLSGKETAGQAIATNTIWLRSTWDVTGLTAFSYSTDGNHFTPLGDVHQVTNFGNFLGAKLGIFTSNNSSESGYVDVDWFRYVFK